jgi:flagellar biosynthesis/type III secretory pathway M-ring protein FliF/YscJ
MLMYDPYTPTASPTAAANSTSSQSTLTSSPYHDKPTSSHYVTVAIAIGIALFALLITCSLIYHLVSVRRRESAKQAATDNKLATEDDQSEQEDGIRETV